MLTIRRIEEIALTQDEIDEKEKILLYLIFKAALKKCKNKKSRSFTSSESDLSQDLF